tara:strand:- start:531 stop:1319 length:789 start_codon:yes stop_codon:yes gene_type:complete
MDIPQRKSWKVLLIGDHCLDIYHYGICERLSPEAPVPILKQQRVEVKQGMSSNVKNNLQSFGIKVHHEKNDQALEKHRIIDSRYNQHLIRFDIGENHLLDEINFDKRIKKVKNVDAVVLSDYNKGLLRYGSLEKICKKFKDVPVFVDTKKTDLSCLSGCIIKLNEKESQLLKKMPIESDFIITLGSKGALYNHRVYSTIETEVFDVCGAGDVFLSGLVFGYLKFKDIEKAIEIGNKCASFSVSKMGTYVMTKEDLRKLNLFT